MWPVDCGILTEDQKARGWSLVEDGDFLYLLRDNSLVAIFSANSVNLLEIHHEIANWSASRFCTDLSTSSW